MSTVRVEINKAGVRALLKSVEVQADLKRRAEAIAAKAGDGMEVETDVGANRARAVVVTRTESAKKAEAKNHTLSRALDAGRG